MSGISRQTIGYNYYEYKKFTPKGKNGDGGNMHDC